MSNKVKFGLENVHISFIDPETRNYGAPVAIPGAVNLSEEAQGDETKFYADNMVYYTTSSNDGYTSELEVALLSDDVKVEMFGWKKDQNGLIVETTDGVQKEFALMAEVRGDSKNRRFVYYKCKASRPSAGAATTTGTAEPVTDKLSITIMPTVIDDEKVVKGTLELSDANETTFNDFFNSVYIPSYA